jgi:cytochrome c oxidase cbb3-type subunit 3
VKSPVARAVAATRNSRNAALRRVAGRTRVGLAAALEILRVLGVVAALGGCGGDLGGGAKDGAAVFQSLCASCHGPDGRPPAAMAARLGVRDLTAPEFRARVNAPGGSGLVEQQVRSGSKNKLMPAFEGAISDAQIRAVAAYVASPQFVSPR